MNRESRRPAVGVVLNWYPYRRLPPRPAAQHAAAPTRANAAEPATPGAHLHGRCAPLRGYHPCRAGDGRGVQRAYKPAKSSTKVASGSAARLIASTQAVFRWRTATAW